MCRMLGPMLEANILASMEGTLRPVVGGACYWLHDASNNPTLEARGGWAHNQLTGHSAYWRQFLGCI